MTSTLVTHAITRRAQQTPAAPAVVAGTKTLSYAELEESSNELAWNLTERGVRRGDRVGLLVGRSCETLTGLLGVLKAGAAYVPIDPGYPDERLAFVLADARPTTVLATGDTVARAERLFPHVCRLDPSPPAARCPTPPPTQVEPTDLAYVIYTSGSTGTPKGAMIEHGNLWNYLDWALHAYAVAEGTGAVVQSPLCFDFTVTLLFTPLLAGKTVFMVADDDISAFVDELRRRKGLSLIKVTPSHLDVLARQLSASEIRGVTRSVVIGGEALHSRQVRWWQEADVNTRFFNEYGPTETTVGCCVHELPAPCPDGPVPIGTPIPRTRLYVLDEDGRPAVPGSQGELYIAGLSVGRGYLNRDDLTIERFVPDPFGNPGQAYRSGDLVREGLGGVLEYLGRIDNQVKIRGYRIELEEVEAILRNHPDVRRVAVIVDEALGNKRIVAYVDGNPSDQSLRDFAAARLPEYAVPSLFVPIDDLPLTGNGKVDRSRLPNAASIRPLVSSAFVSTDSDIEARIASVFGEILMIEEVGAVDSFLELGGDSIIAALAIERLREELGVELPMEDFFEDPTVRGIATAITATI